jgi:hypothetical protein
MRMFDMRIGRPLDDRRLGAAQAPHAAKKTATPYDFGL